LIQVHIRCLEKLENEICRPTCGPTSLITILRELIYKHFNLKRELWCSFSLTVSQHCYFFFWCHTGIEISFQCHWLYDLIYSTDALGGVLTSHLDKTRVYIGCMKSGEVFSEPWVLSKCFNVSFDLWQLFVLVLISPFSHFI
jgi:hypothetical protein